MTKKQRYWEKHVETWKNSGLTQATYCREHGLQVKTFGSQKRKIISELGKQQVVPVPAVIRPLIGHETCARVIKMHVRNKFTLVIEPDFCQETLKRLLEVIDI